MVSGSKIMEGILILEKIKKNRLIFFVDHGFAIVPLAEKNVAYEATLQVYFRVLDSAFIVSCYSLIFFL